MLGSLFLVYLSACSSTNTLPMIQKVGIVGLDDREPKLSIKFLGNTSIYVQDLTKENQQSIFIDAFVSRPQKSNILFTGLSHKNKAEIDKQLNDAGITRVNLIVPLHSHFDHLLDAPYIASTKNARLVASKTTKFITQKMGFCVDFKDLDFNALSNENTAMVSHDVIFYVSVDKAKHTDTGCFASLFAPRDQNYENIKGVDFHEFQKANKYVEGQSINVNILHKPSNTKIYILGGMPVQHAGVTNTKWPQNLRIL